MRRCGALRALGGDLGIALVLGAWSGSAADGGKPAVSGDPRPSVYTANPHVSVGALRLDVRADADGQIPAGWRHADAVRAGSRPDPYRLVKFAGAVGRRQREALARAGYAVVAYHPFNTFLVRPRAAGPAPLSSVAGVSWTGPFHPYFKLASPLAEAVRRGDASGFVVAESHWGLRFSVLLHEVAARPAAAASVATAPGVTRVFPTRTLPLRVQVDPRRFAAFLRHVAAQPEVLAVEPWLPVKLLNDENVQTSQSGNCVDNGVEAPNAPVFSHGLTGWKARLALADSCTDVNSGFWYDDALGRLPAHEPGAPWTSTPPDWSQRKIVEYYDMSAADMAIGCPTADSDHGTAVAGTMTGNCSLNAEGVATETDAANSDGDQDGMAPGAYLIVQDLNGLNYLTAGGTLGELFDVAFENTCLGADCGIDAHNNSWGGLAGYNDHARSGDASLWGTQRGLIVAGSGNEGPGYDTAYSPAIGKNVVAVGGAAACRVDTVWNSSSRGPASDGRLKPDVVAGAVAVTSVNNDGNSDNVNGGCIADKTSNGTSYASPTVAGLSALVLQYFNDGFYPGGAATAFDTLEPSGPLMKAMLINSAQRMTDAATAERNGVSWPNMDQGWGFVVLDNALHFSGDSRKLWIHDEVVGVDATGSSSMTFRRKVTASSEPLKVTLAWYDAPHAGACGAGVPCLDNDLDLSVTEPTSGSTWTTTLVSGTAGHVVPRTVVPAPPAGLGQTTTDNGPDNLNSVEQIIVYGPTPGRIYEFTVTAANTPDGPIPFALVATGALDDPCTAPAGVAPIAAADVDGCGDDGVRVTWNQDVTDWNDGGAGTRSYRVWRDGMPIRNGPCAGHLAYGTTSCIDGEAPVGVAADYRVEYTSGCGATAKTAEVEGVDAVPFLVDVTPDAVDVCPGADIVLTAGADRPGSYTYQWTEDGDELPGETSSTLTIAKGAPESHDYNCRLTDSGSCTRQDLEPATGSWADDPASVEFDAASVPFLTLEELCGDGDSALERGEIWSFDVGVVNTSACHAATNVTAELRVSASSPVAAEVCSAQGEFGDLAPQGQAKDSFAFEVDRAALCPANLFFDLANIDWDGGGPFDEVLAFGVPVGGGCNVTTSCDCATIVVGEVSPTGGIPLTVKRNGSLVDLKFQRVTGATSYNVYVSTQASTLPFGVADPGVGKKSCGVPWQNQLGGTAVSNGFDVEAGIAPGQAAYFILVTADDGPTTEGPLGFTSNSTARDADSRCAD